MMARARSQVTSSVNHGILIYRWDSLHCMSVLCTVCLVHNVAMIQHNIGTGRYCEFVISPSEYFRIPVSVSRNF